MISKSRAIFSTIFIIVGVLCLFGISKKFDTPKEIPFKNVSIQYNSESQINVDDYASKIDEGKFLFTSGNPSELDLALNFSSSHKVSFNIKPQYPDWACEEASIDQAYLSLTSKHLNKSWMLINGAEIAIDAHILKSERLKISIENSLQENCGKAEITIKRASYQAYFIAAFFLIWSMIFLGFLYFNIPIIFAAAGISANVLAIYASASFDYLAFDISFNALAWSVALVSLLLITHHLKIHRYLKGVISTILISGAFIVLLFYTGNYLLFKVPVSNEAIHALWQSDTQEVIEFIESYIGLWILIAIAVLFFISWKIFSRRNNHQSILVVALLSLAMLIPAFVVIPQQSTVNPMLKVFVNGTKEYFQELSEFKEWRELRGNTLPLPDAKLQENGQTVVVILGESANKNNMSLYGYPRDTTPNADQLLSNNEIIRFNSAYANYTHTGNAVAHALTQADQYTDSSWKSAPSIIDLSNSLGIETIWITNQQTFGAWDNQVSVLAEEANEIVSKNKNIGIYKEAEKYDEVMLPALAEALDRNSPNKLIFMHLQGSHLWYCNRFPNKHSPFSDMPFGKSDFGNYASAQKYHHDRVNCYDNSIYYTDQVIKEVISLLESQNEAVSLLYTSDHADDALTGKGHNKDAFTYSMIEIPMFFWANLEWKNSFSEIWQNLSTNSQKVFTNDHLFETISGVLNIESKEINTSNDLSSIEFESVKQPLTQLGEKIINDSANWRHWQRENTKHVLAEQQCEKLLPHRINTIGEMNIILNAGLCGFEIDVLLNNDVSEPAFLVGHDLDTLTGVNLDYVLGEASPDQIKKLWLDIKKVTKDQIPLIIARLHYLDKKYNLKSKAIIETNFFGEETNKIAEAGYQLSYYLPTAAITSTFDQSEEKKQELAIELLNRIESMRPIAVSFDLKLYSFVKDYLEASIPENIVYHTWFPDDLKFSSINVTEQLSNKKYYSDPRVKTILLPYFSPFGY